MKIQFGYAVRTINPQVPCSLAGYFNQRPWNRVLDDIEVRAVVLKDGEACAALLSFDLVTIPHTLCEEIRAAVIASGVPGVTRENLMLTAIHTHTAPMVHSSNAGFNPDYIPYLVGRSVEALQEAVANLHEGEALHGQTRDGRFLFNRRYWMKDGGVTTNPGKLNPGIVRPEGEIDPDIPMLAFAVDGKVELLITSAVNHSDTIGGNGVSADWPGFYHRAVEKATGIRLVVPLIGAEGNINHFDVSTDANQTCYAEAERIGTGLAETVVAHLAKPDALRPVRGNGLKTLFGIAEVLPRRPSPQEVADARAVVAKYPDLEIGADITLTSEDLAKGAPVVLKYFAQELLKLNEDHETRRFFLTGFALGDDAVIASLPSEPFTEIGLELRKGVFGGRTCLVGALANGTGCDHLAGGYIPNAWNFGRGGYETAPRSNRVEPAAAEKLLAAWRRLAARLQPSANSAL